MSRSFRSLFKEPRNTISKLLGLITQDTGPTQHLQNPQRSPSRKFCLLLLIECLGLCLCVPGFNQEYEYLFLCHYHVQIYVKRQWH